MAKCKKCQDTGQIICPACQGNRVIRDYGQGKVWEVDCENCNATGKIDCPEFHTETSN